MNAIIWTKGSDGIYRAEGYEIRPRGKSHRFDLVDKDGTVRMERVSLGVCKTSGAAFILADPRDGSGVQADPTKETIDAVTEAAYDAACACLPEVQAAYPQAEADAFHDGRRPEDQEARQGQGPQEGRQRRGAGGRADAGRSRPGRPGRPGRPDR